MEKYDSTKDTLEHIRKVKSFITEFVGQIFDVVKNHDDSKLYDPERDIFDEYTPKFKDFITEFVGQIFESVKDHDDSKLYGPERDIFDEYTPKLKDSTYGSDEYKQFLKEMGGALNHHYRNNRHHPEHFLNGMNGMNLVDIIEMLCDWKAATLRHEDGDMLKSLEINIKRFKIDFQLAKILHNTILDLGWNKK